MPSRPEITAVEAERLAARAYAWPGRAEELPAEHDRNFLIEREDGTRLVLKVAPAHSDPEHLGFQLALLGFLADTSYAPFLPTPRPTIAGELLTLHRSDAGVDHPVRALTYLDGFRWAELPGPPPERLLDALGRLLAGLDQALLAFDHPGAHRVLEWDIRRTLHLEPLLDHVPDPGRRRLVNTALVRFRTRVAPHLHRLPTSVIHNDANDHNILLTGTGDDLRLAGLIDVGDAIATVTVAELAIAAAYAMLDRTDPVTAAVPLIRGYDRVRPLLPRERELLPDLVLARLAASVLISARNRAAEPDNRYLQVSAEPAWQLLERLVGEDGRRLAAAVDTALAPPGGRSPEALAGVRRGHLGPSLSLSYSEPLKIVRGQGQYLFDHRGRRYLDLVNNVCHVGHCHPRVVAAAQRQTAILNTNTRYLHDHLADYVERLTATLPPPLEVVYLVCSGSEANDLALRLAMARTGRRGVVVLDHAYHGNLSSLVEISPYKCDGPGGLGLAGHARKVPLPDPYRGRHRGPASGPRYATHVAEASAELAAAGHPAGAFIAESVISCGGQIVLPEGFLAAAHDAARRAGAVCIADEVQVGFGRVGSHLWAFETQGVVPDIVTLGKPIGNGHPLAAVVTTREIADAFASGMEYFNTFGGNPVSCAVGLAVLEVIGDEGLQGRALELGRRLLDGAAELARRHPVLGDARGLGLFVGLELVADRAERTPDAGAAHAVVEAMKAHGFLLSTDGPDHNVIKIKPPMVLTAEDVDLTLTALDEVLASLT